MPAFEESASNSFENGFDLLSSWACFCFWSHMAALDFAFETLVGFAGWGGGFTTGWGGGFTTGWGGGFLVGGSVSSEISAGIPTVEAFDGALGRVIGGSNSTGLGGGFETGLGGGCLGAASGGGFRCTGLGFAGLEFGAARVLAPCSSRT